MKLIIEISEEVYEHYKNTPLIGTPDAICWPDEIKKAVRKATPIPDNATNRDVMCSIFPKVTIDKVMCIDMEWWNSPYR